MPYKTPGGMCNLHVLAKYLEHEAAHNRIKIPTSRRQSVGYTGMAEEMNSR